MSESSTETESMSGSEEEMAMMSITDVIPVCKNLGEMVISEKKPVVFAKERPVAHSVKGSGLKNGGEGEGEAVARAKDSFAQNGVNMAAKNRRIARSDGEPRKEFGIGEMQKF